MNISETLLQEYALQDQELEEVFNSLKSNKSPGFEDISLSVVKFCGSGIFNPLKHIFNLSLQTGIFPNGIKIARFLPVFKKMRNSFLLITGQYQCCHISPNYWRG